MFEVCELVKVKVNVNVFVVDHKVYSSSQVELLTLMVFVMYLLRYVLSSSLENPPVQLCPLDMSISFSSIHPIITSTNSRTTLT